MAKGDIARYKNKLMGNLISNTDLVKALIIKDDFFNATPTSEQLAILNDPTLLLYEQIFPYMKSTKTMVDGKVYITSFFDFTRQGLNYKKGTIRFYVIVPVDWIKTDFGNRTDFIVDEIEELFKGHNIGDFQITGRGDLPVDDKFIGGYISFNITDFL